MQEIKRNIMMPEFREPEIKDHKEVYDLIKDSGMMACDYNFAGIMLWKEHYRQKICIADDMLISKVTGRLGDAFLCPAGHGSFKEAVQMLIEYCKAEGSGLLMVCVTDEQKILLEKDFPGRFAYEEDRDAWDYVYLAEKLAELKGRRLHGKRNHINSFVKNAPDWKFELIKQEDRDKCIRVLEEWAKDNLSDGASRESFKGGIGLDLYALENAGKMGIVCGAVTVKGRVAAFSAGSLTNPLCFNIHSEKATDEIPGSYQIINREMARFALSEYPGLRWINREDDMGIEGLRRAKESYYPEMMIRKYIARLLQ